MLLKLLGGIIIAFGAWLLGKNVSESFYEKIKLIDAYISLLKNFRSAVSFSGINMYSFFEKNKDVFTEKFLDFLIEKKDIQQIFNYKTENIQEQKCISIIADAFILAQSSSDRELISDFSEESILKLTQYKNEVWEEYRGKIKTAPALGLISGLFVAVLII